MRITHPILVFGLSKNPLDRLFAQSVNPYTTLCLAQLPRQIQVLLPYMGGQDMLTLCGGTAGLPAGTVPPVLRRATVETLSALTRGRVPQSITLRTNTQSCPSPYVNSQGL